ncbi:Probable nicotinate-nucleotide pyrophosphorylase [carboxylating] [Peptoniphilus harei]|uniref:carboxylating nicotinate-nucleotide diphosphorylase n=1 Tax=Peptoniphilus harei TaxID=54005 RepID=UPI000F6F35EF|nr:carboxylating nicotinate-nucleotide diphosphorylase [Peptoniphilus harei]QQE46852.1 carboxylating nicotinate-nucleotide diphosphorylase [Peptoniphilus harei]VEJ34996.1 Probable nicotinate-nucleotide pyrophosphorylase [carboxylating] [Peptoniphilus harei]
MRELKPILIDKYILAALREDMTSGDITTDSILKDEKAEVNLIAKDKGILAGLDVFKRVFELLDEDVTFEFYFSDGDEVNNKDLIGKISGRAKAILEGERTALNFLQRMSGIATYTKKMVDALDSEHVKILDTRKTTPNMRIFEKYAVTLGGGYNHRYNLSDGIMLKDNHIDAGGGIREAVERVRSLNPFVKKIEVEVENFDQVREALEAKADIIMLDNMEIEEIREACKIINKRAIIECSGNVSLENINSYKDLDIDYISSGAITYSAGVLDLSMKNLKIY